MEDNQQRLPAIRGDSFDIGPRRTADGWDYGPQNQRTDIIEQILSNPRQLFGPLNKKQADNIRSGLVGIGTFLTHKYLAPYVGDNLAGAAGGLISAFIARKILPRELVQGIEDLQRTRYYQEHQRQIPYRQPPRYQEEPVYREEPPVYREEPPPVSRRPRRELDADPYSPDESEDEGDE